MTKKLIKTLNIKHKIFNHLMVNGNKETCEKTFLKSSKSLQKSLLKNYQELIKIGIINTAPIVNVKQVKLKKGKKKNVKEYPFVLDSKNRISLAIKFIIETVKKKENKPLYLYTNLKQEIIANSQNNGSAIKKKDELQKNTLLKKQYAYYRWF
jgi:small subunit ribosomal protein S7